MKKPRLEELIMSRLFVPKTDIDPNDWQTYVRHNIVREVRSETIRFYGPIDCLESQYPGLDYSKPAHRLRLGHYPCHRKLFRIFDQLRLTDNEIHRLCKWEGTKYARDAYEANNRIKIRDTTCEGITDSSHKLTTATRISLRGGHFNVNPKAFVENRSFEEEGRRTEDSEEEQERPEEESEDEMQHSVGVELNHRLLAATEARARGENVIIDADWEQWLKEAAERGVPPDWPQVVNSTSAPTDAGRIPAYLGQGIPEYLSDNPTPENAAFQASLPLPPRHNPQAHSNVEYTTEAIAPSAPRNGTSL